MPIIKINKRKFSAKEIKVISDFAVFGYANSNQPKKDKAIIEKFFFMAENLKSK